MNGTAQFKKPSECTEGEHREFARLVRRGFEGSDAGLPDRIRKAKRLAFLYASDDTLVAIAALKAPDERYRNSVFEAADAGVVPADYEAELGWVFVEPVHRGNGIAESLSRRLLDHVPTSCVYATTRPGNDSMKRILFALGFVRAGNSIARRNEELVLLLRSRATSGVAAPAG